ncbi:TetR family transcriptional regulator [Rhodococcus opacus]|nr:TetR family transcriptional regulator [Rhodococcus opacus]
MIGTSKAAAHTCAAIEIFADKGYGATSTREIAASLALSLGAV